MKFIKDVPVTHLSEDEKRDWRNSIRRKSCTNPLTGKTVTYNGATAAMLEMLCRRPSRVPTRVTRQSARHNNQTPVTRRPVTRSMANQRQVTTPPESEDDSDSDYSDSDSEIEEQPAPTVVRPRATRQGVRKEVIRTIYYY